MHGVLPLRQSATELLLLHEIVRAHDLIAHNVDTNARCGVPLLRRSFSLSFSLFSLIELKKRRGAGQ